MDYRTTPNELMITLTLWNELIPGRGRIHLIGCGGTALTLLGYKESTKDVDLLVPRLKEYERLIRFLERAGYQRTTTFGWHRPGEGAIYDLYPGKRVYLTELLTSPLLRGENRKIREWKRIYLGVLRAGFTTSREPRCERQAVRSEKRRRWRTPSSTPRRSDEGDDRLPPQPEGLG